MPLVVVGARGWLYDDVFRAVERLELARRVRFAGHVPGEQLPLWYNAAEVFVYPSLYEGFGLPPLEALACGTPVLAYRRGSIPELIDDGITGFVCEGPSKMAAAVEQVSLIDRHRCRQAFEDRFTVERMVQDYLAVYEDMVGQVGAFTVPDRSRFIQRPSVTVQGLS